MIPNTPKRNKLADKKTENPSGLDRIARARAKAKDKNCIKTHLIWFDSI
jgi:hypothetical protein